MLSQVKIRNITKVQNTAQNIFSVYVQNLDNQFLVVKTQYNSWNLNFLPPKWSLKWAFANLSLVHLSNHIYLRTAGLICISFWDWSFEIFVNNFLTVFIFLSLKILCKFWDPSFYHRGICWLIQQLGNHRTLVQLRQQTTWHISTLACCNRGDYFGFFTPSKSLRRITNRNTRQFQ